MENINEEVVTFEIMKQIINEMCFDNTKLQEGYSLFTKIEFVRGFYTSLLTIVYDKDSRTNEIKLSSSVLMLFLRRNWSDYNYMSLQEKMECFALLSNNIHHTDYYINHFTSKLLGIISAKEWPNSYDMLISKLIKGMRDPVSEQQTETYLRIMSYILKECDDRIANMTSELLPVIIDVFKTTKSMKNREKCLKIISQILNKLSFADGTDPELITKSLDSNNCIEQCISLFIQILIERPKNLFDIKKYAIKTLDILVRDMPVYSSSFFTELIEPAWKVIVSEMTLYTELIVFNSPLEFTEKEIQRAVDDGFDYTRGYESDDEDEVYGIEGFVGELIDFAVDNRCDGNMERFFRRQIKQ